MCRADGAKIFIKLLVEETTVRQTGQWVVPCQIAGVSFRGRARLDFTGEILIAAESKNSHRDTEDEHHENDVVGLLIGVRYAKLK
ncbi:hypothetical protein [Bradyrhizobium sp.]|uniref:hypothetical protein n=1 Tax=Bradyrhizobium sp. TaxID=376 RepID=UPI003BAFB397